MKWKKEEENEAKKEYLSMIDTLLSNEEFKNEWKGHWDYAVKKTITGKMVKVKGDKDKYMKYWIDNKSIINDTKWNEFLDFDDI